MNKYLATFLDPETSELHQVSVTAGDMHSALLAALDGAEASAMDCELIGVEKIIPGRIEYSIYNVEYLECEDIDDDDYGLSP